jgi:hypothetical protein
MKCGSGIPPLKLAAGSRFHMDGHELRLPETMIKAHLIYTHLW